MRFAIEQHPKPDPYGWKRKFAWRPTRVSPSRIVWLESYWRRFVIVCEGNWAGGARYRYDYLTDGGTIWEGPEFGDC